MSKKITLTMDEFQAGVVSHACEFLCRIMLGQFAEIPFDLMLPQELDDEWCDRREAAETYLFMARNYIYPELQGRGHSYGIGKFKDADTAWNVTRCYAMF